MYDQLINNKGAEMYNEERLISSVNGFGNTKQPHAKE